MFILCTWNTHFQITNEQDNSSAVMYVLYMKTESWNSQSKSAKHKETSKTGSSEILSTATRKWAYNYD